MKSIHIIVVTCVILWIMHWTGDAFPVAIPMAFTAAFLAMDLLGFFKRENSAVKEVAEEDRGLNDRQKAFRKSLKEGRPDEPDAIIRMVNQDGEESLIVIKSNGEIEVEGNPEPEIVEIAHHLKDSIKQFGVDSIAEQIGAAIEKLNTRNAKDKE